MKLLVGFITYNEYTAKYLPYFLPSLLGQSFRDFRIFIVDNSENKDNDNFRFLKLNYPDLEVWQTGENLGFAKANNLIFKKAIESGAEYVMLLNPDTLLKLEAVGKLVAAMDSDASLGSAGAKILKWDFENNIQTGTIDSCGIAMNPGLRFFDLGQGRMEISGAEKESIIGPSGTAPIYRVKALEKVGFFDERMFMYKEDCDMAYRLMLAGFKTALVPDAIIYHDRSTAGSGENDVAVALNRKNKSHQSKRWSFVNQHLMFFKFWDDQTLTGKIAILWYALEMFAFVLIFEQYLLKEYGKIWNFTKKAESSLMKNVLFSAFCFLLSNKI